MDQITIGISGPGNNAANGALQRSWKLRKESARGKPDRAFMVWPWDIRPTAGKQMWRLARGLIAQGGTQRIAIGNNNVTNSLLSS